MTTSPNLYDLMREWVLTQSHLIADEWNGPGAYSMEIVCTECHRTVGVVNNDKYVAYKYLASNAVPNLEVSEFIPADPKFFNKIKSTSHGCPKSLINVIRDWF